MNAKEKNTTIYILALIGIAGYVFYNKWKKEKEEKELTEDEAKRRGLILDNSYFTEERGRSFVSKELYENKDPEFMAHVTHLQQKLNEAIKKMGPETFPFYPLKIDGLLGWRTALAIVRVFGEGYVPIKDKKTITYLYTNFQ